MEASEMIQWRQARGLSQTEFARQLGVHRMTVVKWETGQRNVKRPTGRLLELALKGLACELDRAQS